MPDTLRAGDVANAIRATMAGRRTKAELGQWAFQAFLDNDNDVRPFAVVRTRDIIEALRRLMMMSEGPEYELEDAELQSIAERLASGEED